MLYDLGEAFTQFFAKWRFFYHSNHYWQLMWGCKNYFLGIEMSFLAAEPIKSLLKRPWIWKNTKNFFTKILSLILHKKSSQCALKFDFILNVEFFFSLSQTLDVITRKFWRVKLKVKKLNLSSSWEERAKSICGFHWRFNQ